MKKLLRILILGLLWSSNAYALSLSCKSEHNGEIITNTTYDLSRDSEHRPEYTNTHIYWRTWRFKDDSTLALAIYNSVDRYSGAFKQRITGDAPLAEQFKKNRKTAKIVVTIFGSCKESKKKF